MPAVIVKVMVGMPSLTFDVILIIFDVNYYYNWRHL